MEAWKNKKDRDCNKKIVEWKKRHSSPKTKKRNSNIDNNNKHRKYHNCFN